jgi:hypothetical protein
VVGKFGLVAGAAGSVCGHVQMRISEYSQMSRCLEPSSYMHRQKGMQFRLRSFLRRRLGAGSFEKLKTMNTCQGIP